MSDSEDPIDPIDEGGDDLFGDEDDDVASLKERVLDDDDLASDPEGDTYAHYRNEDEDQTQHVTKDRVVMAVRTYRHRIPKPKENALRVLRVPNFIKMNPEEYDPDTFQPSELDLVNARSQNTKHVARVRRDHDTGELKSNTNVYRWSDGSVTISVGGEHYEVSKKGLAPPADKPYNEIHDGHYYAAAAELRSNILLTVGHITEQYNIRPNKAVGDDALSVLAERMAAASKQSKDGEMIIRTTRDPELQKKQAEMAEKERMKAQRRRENAAAKLDGGLGRSGRGGLSIGDLEGGRRGAGMSRKRGAPGAAKPKRRRPEYDSDDDLPQGVSRQEDYDLDDGFLVGSDEEEMDSDAEEDEEEILEDEEEERPRSKKKRTREPDEDAEGSDAGPVERSGKSRRRNVIDSDEE